MSGDVDQFIARLEKLELLTEPEIRWVCASLKILLARESNITQLSSPITVVGDIHGQFLDLQELFRIAGSCPDTNFLFLGDYVDRGPHSIETISLLACLKLRYPQRVTLLRGNHETRQITQVYGFYSECLKKYGSAEVWRHFTDMFDCLSLAAVIDGTYFCVHGGLSPSIHTLDHVRLLERFQEIPHDGALADLVWSDPNATHMGFQHSQRGVGYSFGADVVRQFLELNRFDCILRAHQLCANGYQILFDETLMTIWSAPNYCGRCGNVASVMEIDCNRRYFNVFNAAPESEKQQPSAGAMKEIPEFFT